MATEVLSLDGIRDAVLARVRELYDSGGSVAADLKALAREEKRILARIDRLVSAIESGEGKLQSLTASLAEREKELAILRARRQELEAQAGRKAPRPSAAMCICAAVYFLFRDS